MAEAYQENGQHRVARFRGKSTHSDKPGPGGANAISGEVLLSGVQSSGGPGADGHANKWEEQRSRPK
jgi:hypothetical protein